MAERKNSAARIRANNKYNDKAYDRVNIAIPKGQKDVIRALANAQGESLNMFAALALKERIERLQAAADTAGESLNGYVTKAVDERMERDTEDGM